MQLLKIETTAHGFVSMAHTCMLSHEFMHVNMNKKKYFIIYSNHVTNIFFNIIFQRGGILYDVINILCYIGKIFQYFAMSFT